MLRLFSALPLLLILACDSTEPQGCERFEFTLAPEPSAPHLASCASTSCGNGMNPPSAGPHCATTLSCRVYTAEQPSCSWLHNLEHGHAVFLYNCPEGCSWLHNLEHGHAVFLYNCPEGCPDEVARLEQIQKEARRGTNDVPRAIVAPAPGLPNRVAALLWRRTYLADSADPEALRCLLALQDREAPEPGLGCAP